MPIPTRSVSLREPSKKSSIGTGRSAIAKPAQDGSGPPPTAASTDSQTPANRRKSLLPQRSIPGREDQQPHSQQENRLRSLVPMKGMQEHTAVSETSAVLARRRSMIRPAPVKIGTGKSTSTSTTTGTVVTTPKSTTFAPSQTRNREPPSPRKDMAPPARPNRSASLRQPAAGVVGVTGITSGHIRHRSQIVAPSGLAARRSESRSSGTGAATATAAAGTRMGVQFTTYQQQFSAKKRVTPSAGTAAVEDNSLFPATWPEIAALQTELLQLNLLHSSSLQRTAEWEAQSQVRLRTTYESVANGYRAMVGREKEAQRLLNGEALNQWVENAREHNGRQSFAEQIQVFSQIVQEVCDLTDGRAGRYTMLVQEFEDWFDKAQAIGSMRRHCQPGDSSHVVFIDPLDRTWKEEVYAMTMKLEQCARQLQSLDLLGYGEEEKLADATLLRTAKGLDKLIASMVEELKAIRGIEANIVKSERQWVRQLTGELTATHTEDARDPKTGMWRTALLRS